MVPILAVLVTAAVAYLVLVQLPSFGGSPAGVNPASPTATARDQGYITRAEYGAAWPFSVPAGTLRCYDGAAAGGGGRVLVTFDTGNGIEYALNGSARDFGFPDPDDGTVPAWPNTTGLNTIIKLGLGLC